GTVPRERMGTDPAIRCHRFDTSFRRCACGYLGVGNCVLGYKPEVVMRSILLYEEKGLKTFALVFDKDEQVKESLLAFAGQNHLSAAQISAIGAFSEVTLGYFQRPSKTYKEIPIREQVEVLSLSGNIAVK